MLEVLLDTDDQECHVLLLDTDDQEGHVLQGPLQTSFHVVGHMLFEQDSRTQFRKVLERT